MPLTDCYQHKSDRCNLKKIKDRWGKELSYLASTVCRKSHLTFKYEVNRCASNLFLRKVKNFSQKCVSVRTDFKKGKQIF